MKKFFTIIVLAALSLTAVAQQKKVAVYVTGEDAGINKVLGSKLVSAIARSEEFSAIERTESFLAELNKEQHYQRTGAVDDSDLSRLGKQFGAQYVCVATVSDAFNEKYLSARLIDVETAQVERTASSNGTIQALDDIVTAADVISNELLFSLKNGLKSDSKKVAVYVVKSDAAKNIGRVLGDKLVAGFTNSGRYIAIERTNSFLSQLSKEQNYQHSGAVDDSDLSRLGKQFGVQYVCVVDVSDVFGEKYISARLIDVETAEVVNSHDVGSAMNSMRSCFTVANEISNALSQVTLAEFSQEKKRIAQEGYVDLGLSSGTCWKKTNEPQLMSYNDAMKYYENYLPTQEQCTELIEKCEWIYTNGRIRIVGPNGNYITINATHQKPNVLYACEYLTKSTRSGLYKDEWYNYLLYLQVSAKSNDPDYRGKMSCFNDVDYYKIHNELVFGILCCQCVDAFAKRQYDDREGLSQKKYNMIYSHDGEYYCDGTYQEDGGHTFATSDLEELNPDYFRVTFSFKALKYTGLCNAENECDIQYPLVLSMGRNMGVCLHSDGNIFIETNNSDHDFDCKLKYIPNQYQNIDIEYYNGWLTINGHKIWVDMDTKEIYDKVFYSINYGCGNSFKGYLKDVKIYNVTNIEK